MRGTKILTAVLAAGALSLGPAIAMAASWASATPQKSATSAPQARKWEEIHGVRGEVTAVDLGGKSITVEEREGAKMRTVRADITGKTTIRQGWLHRTPTDLKVGSHVDMMYEGTSGKWVADNIRILEPSVAAMPVQGPDDGRA